MKYELVACILAGVLMTPAAAALVDEDVDFEDELADATGCDGINVYANEDPDAGASFYQYNEEDEKQECEPSVDEPADEHEVLVLDFEDELAPLADATGCDGLEVSEDRQGLYAYNEDDEREDCEPGTPEP